MSSVTPRPGARRAEDGRASSRSASCRSPTSHIGFAKGPQSGCAPRHSARPWRRSRRWPAKPDFIIHTGDITQLSKAQEFDDADQILKEAGLTVFHVPGEHDMLDEANGKAYLDRYGKGSLGDGWYSFDHNGVHFVGPDQRQGAEGRRHGLVRPAAAGVAEGRPRRPARPSTPIVVFTHVPMWTVYEKWGLGHR